MPNIEFHFTDETLPTGADETVLVDLGGGYRALVEYVPPPVGEPESPAPDRFYAVAKTNGPTVLHAVVVTHRGQRFRADRYTLCSKNDSRMSGGHRKDIALSSVTCRQCLRHLEAEGVV